MKKIIIGCLLLTASFASADTFTFSNISTAGVSTNAAVTCAIMEGKYQSTGTFDVSNIYNVSMSKAGVSTFSSSQGADYSIKCFLTSDSATADTVKFSSNRSISSAFFPISTLLLYQGK